MIKSFSDSGLGKTASGTVIGLLATAALASQPIAFSDTSRRDMRVESQGESATSGNLSSRSGSYLYIDSSHLLMAEIANAYEHLVANQKPLDQEFANILSANLWDLYAR